jgi:hypothetical protein
MNANLLRTLSKGNRGVSTAHLILYKLKQHTGKGRSTGAYNQRRSVSFHAEQADGTHG